MGGKQSGAATAKRLAAATRFSVLPGFARTLQRNFG